MYLDFFNLSDYPFRLSPDLDYLYMSGAHSRAKAYLDYSIVSKDGFVVITGEVGSGKTILMRKLLEELPDDAILVHIEQTQLNSIEFLQAVIHGLIGHVDTANKVELQQRLRTFVEHAREADTRVVIAVDEAQLLSIEVLEEVRMLSDLEAGKEKLISIILMGQPELDRVIDSPNMEQFRQRVRLRFHLEGMTEVETRTYVQVRLAVAGASEPESIIRNDACPLLYEYTGGIPRLINTLCDMALLTAYVAQSRNVGPEVMQSAINELGWKRYSERRAALDEATARRNVAFAGVPSGVIPMSALNRLNDTLENIDRSLDRIAAVLDQQESVQRKRGASS